MKDQIFQDQKEPNKDFSFTPAVAEVFDDMLARSVPFYQETIGMSAQLLRGHVAKNSQVYDLGCSTGGTLVGLARHLDDLELQFIGIDNSPAMIAKAVLKAEVYGKQHCLQFVEADILDVELKNPAAIIMNYTLQFVRPIQRQAFVEHLYQSLAPGGILLISEKTISHDPLFNRSFIAYYLDFKRAQGYSEIEISQKREALENVLVPFSRDENIQLMQDAGFKHIEQYFQWFNFSSFVAIKK